MGTESSIQQHPEGTGPKVRTLKQTSPSSVDATGKAQADTAVHQQMVTQADERGDVPGDLSGEILGELQAIHEALDLIAMRLA